MPIELAGIPGVAETAVPPDLLAKLPPDAPQAPWQARAHGIVWWTRPNRDALADALSPGLGNITPLFVVAAMLSYQETPVGPYSEVMAIVIARRGGDVFAHVPFITVDSPASVVGGRANWALPKTLAQFHGVPQTETTMSAAGPGWEIHATPHAQGPALPWLLPPIATLVQIGPDGDRWSARLKGHGTARLAHIMVNATAAPGLADLFPTGRFPGVLSKNLTGHLPPATRDHRNRSRRDPVMPPPQENRR